MLCTRYFAFCDTFASANLEPGTLDKQVLDQVTLNLSNKDKMKQRQKLTNPKANQRMRVGATAKVVLVGAVTLACAGGSVAGFAAWQSPKTGMAANRDQSVVAGETARTEHEHL